MRVRPFLALVLLAASCSGPNPASAPLVVEKAPSAQALATAVAVVDGEPISAAEVKAEAEAAGTDARSALDALVDAKLLVREAAGRGLGEDPAVRDAVEREMVRRLLRTGFEREVTPAAVTDDQIRRAYEKNWDRFDRPELYKVLHILAPVAPDATSADREAAFQRANAVAARAKSAKTSEAFRAIVPALTDDKIKLKGEEVMTGRSGWTVKPFADAAFALAKPGDVSGVVETRFGFHVIYLEEKQPPLQVTLANVKEVLREGLWPETQRHAFGRLVDELVDRHHIEKYEARLEEEAAAATAPEKP